MTTNPLCIVFLNENVKEQEEKKLAKRFEMTVCMLKIHENQQRRKEALITVCMTIY